jgi:hypothetical protein
MQGFHACTPLKGLLKKSLKNLQNLQKLKSIIHMIYQCFLELFGVPNLFCGTACSARFMVGVRGQSPLKSA